MTPAAHALAAIEVLTEVEDRRAPAPQALKDWGAAHRFAGSGDRARIASLVYDALRARASIAWRMGSDSPRALILGALAFARGRTAEEMTAAFAASQHAPAPPDEAESAAIAAAALDGAPPHVLGDYPEWLDAAFADAFGDARAEEGAALARRAPLDLRVNVLKGDRDKALRALSHLKAEPTPHAPFGVRIPLTDDGRGPPVQSEPAHLKGLVEVQDEGSQLAALIAAAAPGEQVVDLCAGAGGKTLALGASMGNRGQLYAHDSDLRRLAPLNDRAARAGLRNLQIRSPRRDEPVLADLEGRADLVLVDAPCTGTGTWRRNPDAKWRMRPGALEIRMAEQDAALDAAAVLVKEGGRLVYVTCSLLPAENEARIAAFRERHPGFAPIAAREAATTIGAPELAAFATTSGEAFLFSPRRSGTDGFFVCALRRT
ncbi:RsmB/NOP family class I SAM-dependent RNA methyltransferase [Hansschlegelia zhihuaiae]|uniref:RsmB/NOP family class I SAM-dependent RNA methyltransferase n=1 Tax=Hansschlegelia zhihuaiae TaxID=405005 RepID=A0A4Q0M2J9_9HYPH|nr:RsmB/NOP family class I SAM-dependent RNA methyltransferase [Hansschlegelia zhihuaiae]RXF67098.1 RsmB/NOP family class I SAM-dependent RNA methyltransferase [Hansschlegelia zhihuaiae]